MSYGPSRDPGLSGKMGDEKSSGWPAETRPASRPWQNDDYMYFRRVLMVSATSQV